MRITLLIFGLSILYPSTSAAQDPALQRLEDSPRHHEWGAIPQGDRIVHAFVVYPERETPAPAVIVIHENRGLNDWVRSVADRLAEHGYLAIAPDLLSGMGPEGGKTSDFPDSDAAREALYQLPPDQVTADLNAAADYVASLPAADGSVSVSGFCWGGSQTFRFATNRSGLDAAFVFYGSGPTDPDAIGRINAPVFGFYGGDDARVNATIPDSEKLMKAASKKYEPVIYDGAGHGFMRRGETAPAGDPNAVAHERAWTRWLTLLEKL
ncbi:MAG: dienelactone hydrolase family protein [Rhodothermales bacterium]|nr:dienelactone hydrolase family protein [Rhodothermales bacterium]